MKKIEAASDCQINMSEPKNHKIQQQEYIYVLTKINWNLREKYKKNHQKYSQTSQLYITMKTYNKQRTVLFSKHSISK